MFYLQLFNGSEIRGEAPGLGNLDGPILGPFWQVFGVYNSNIRVQHHGTRGEEVFWYIGDQLYYDGMYYGDWRIFTQEASNFEIEKNSRYEKLDPCKMNPPGTTGGA